MGFGRGVVFTTALVLLIAAAAAAATSANALFPKIFEHDSPHVSEFKKNLQKVNIPKLFENAEIGEKMEFEQQPKRTKRASGFGGDTCNPGWTGASCEFPICGESNFHDHGPQEAKQTLVDIYYARNASRVFYIYVDNTMHGQELQLQSDSGPISPRLILIDSNGTIYTPNNQDEGPENSIYTFSYLPVQTYKVQLSADDPAGSMILLYNAWTYLSTEIGGITYQFLDDMALHDDYPEYKFYNHVPTVFVVAPIGLEYPGSLVTVSFLSDSVPAPHNIRLDLRYGCHYLYYTNGFTCGAEGNFFARVRGYDFYGHSFTRIHSFVCEIPLPTSAPPTMTTSMSTGSPPPFRCMNGGLPITKADGTQYCYCNGLYTGQYCGTPLCMNDGEARGGICICKSGFSGSHCQNVQCTDDAGAGTRIGTPILTFVIRVRTQMSSIISQVSAAVSQIVNDLNYDTAYVSRFGLVTFNNNASSTISFYSANDLIAALNASATTSDSSGGCKDIAFESVYSALDTFMITNKSPIYVITDAEPYDSEDYIQGIFHLNSFYQAPIHFFFIQPSSTSGCQNMDFDAHPFVEMGLIARRFSGLATLVTSDLVSSFQSFLYTHLSHTYHKAHLVFGDDQYQCQNLPAFIPISVDVQFHELVIIVAGNITSVQINSPEDDVVQFTNKMQYGGTTIYWLTGLQTGTWTATVIPISGRSPCTVRIFAVEDPTPQTIAQDYHLVYGITPALTLDAPERQPFIGASQSIVAHIENYPLRNPWELNAEIVVYTDGGSNSQGRNFVMASNGIWRRGCSYEIYFPPFRCFTEGLNMYFTIFVKDAMGNAIQRAGVFFCTSVQTTPAPQPGECVNGGIPYNNTCICPPGWAGPNCQTRVCFNNGTLTAQGYCQCPPGTGGEWCQLLKCITQNNRPGFGQNGRHMIFILDVTRNNAPALSDMAPVVAEVIRDISSQDRRWITRYFVFGADSQRVYRIGDTTSDNSGHVQDFFNTALNMSMTSTDTSCTIKIYEAIREGMRDFNDRSYITVFTSSAPDESMALNSTLPAYDAVLRGHHMLNVFAAASNGNFACGQKVDYQLLSDLADVTTGRLLTLTKIEFYLAMKLIPTWYTSSMIYRKTFADCSQNATIFAPIDSFTQSIQVYLNGQNAGSGFSVVIPDGTEYDNIGNIVADTSNGVAIYDLRRPCDEGWESMGPNVPYCFAAFYDYQSWDSARQICSDTGGFLVDDLTSSKDTFLSSYTSNKPIWIGLNSKNGSYYWDRGTGVPQDSFNGSTFNKWYNGDGSVDPNKPCVYRDGDGYWKKDSCDAQKFYVCQKHLYTATYTPNDINDDDLPGGRWMFSFKTPGQCQIEVRVQSSIIVYAGFTTHLLEDHPFEAGISGSTDNRLIAHMDGIVSPNHIPFLRFAHILDPVNGTIYRAATYQYRTQCAYEYLSQTFTCPNTTASTNRFEIMHVGEDEFGLPFQRITSAICEAPRTDCGGHGLVYNGLCICDQYWQGQYCEVPRCVNGGVINTADNTCQCPLGYAGRACQYDICFVNSNTTFSPDGKTFVLAVEATQQNQAAIQDFGSQLNDILNGVPSTWFTSYILVTFDANGVSQAQQTSSISDFVSKYNSATSSLSSAGGCDFPVFAALLAGINAGNIPFNSVIYLLTTGGSSQSDQQTPAENYWLTAANSDSQLFYFLIKSTQCPNEISSNNSLIVTEVAVGTDGNILEVSNTNVGRLAKQHLPSLYNGTVSGTPTISRTNLYTCNNLVFYLPVGQTVTQVFLYSYTTNNLPMVTGPDGTTVTLSSTHIDQNSVFSSFTPPQQGFYTITLNDTGTCMLQVRIQGGAEIYPAYISVPSDNPLIGNHLDNATSVPVYGMNLLVAGVLNEFVELQYASLYSPHRSSGEIQYIQMYLREGCSYNYYSDPFNCDEEYYYVTFYGMGYAGQPFYRSSYTKCLGWNPNMTTTAAPSTSPMSPTTPTTPITGPPNTATSPTIQTTTSFGYQSILADVVLILDGSDTVTPSQMTDLKNILNNALSQFTIDPNYVDVAIIVALGDQFPVALVKNTFRSIITTQGLKNAVTTAYQNAEFESQTGQDSLSFAIKQLYNQDFLNRGYRNNITNHLALYVTTTNSPNAAAISEAATVMQQNLFKFMAIGYQGGANQGALTSLVGGKQDCTIVTYDQTAITNKIVSKIWNANFNSGSYC
uniref:Uncharacterized protein n=1 Tax=Panagrolaimus sp. PS1159 TaxID=55785 RepID=A0AC35G0Z0_9BILA